MTTTQISKTEPVFQNDTVTSAPNDHKNTHASSAKDTLKQRIGQFSGNVLTKTQEASSILSDISTVISKRVVKYFADPSTSSATIKPKTLITPPNSSIQEAVSESAQCEISLKTFKDFTTSVYSTITDYFSAHAKQANETHLSAALKPAFAPQKISPFKLKQIATPTSAQIQAQKKRLEPKPERQPDLITPKTFSEITTSVYQAITSNFADYAKQANEVHPTPTIKLVATSKQPAELAKIALKPIPAKQIDSSEEVTHQSQTVLASNPLSEITTRVYNAIAERFDINPIQPTAQKPKEAPQALPSVSKPTEPVKVTKTTPTHWRTKDIKRIALWGIAAAVAATAAYYGYQYLTEIPAITPPPVKPPTNTWTDALINSLAPPPTPVIPAPQPTVDTNSDNGLFSFMYSNPKTDKTSEVPTTPAPPHFISRVITAMTATPDIPEPTAVPTAIEPTPSLPQVPMVNPPVQERTISFSAPTKTPPITPPTPPIEIPPVVTESIFNTTTVLVGVIVTVSIVAIGCLMRSKKTPIQNNLPIPRPTQPTSTPDKTDARSTKPPQFQHLEGPDTTSSSSSAASSAVSSTTPTLPPSGASNTEIYDDRRDEDADDKITKNDKKATGSKSFASALKADDDNAANDVRTTTTTTTSSKSLSSARKADDDDIGDDDDVIDTEAKTRTTSNRRSKLGLVSQIDDDDLSVDYVTPPQSDGEDEDDTRRDSSTTTITSTFLTPLARLKQGRTRALSEMSLSPNRQKHGSGLTTDDIQQETHQDLHSSHSRDDSDTSSAKVAKKPPPPPPPPPPKQDLNNATPKTEAQLRAEWDKKDKARLKTEWQNRADSWSTIVTLKESEAVTKKNGVIATLTGMVQDETEENTINTINAKIEKIKKEIEELNKNNYELSIIKTSTFFKQFSLQELKLLYKMLLNQSEKCPYSDDELKQPNASKFDFFLEREEKWHMVLSKATWIRQTIAETIQDYINNPENEPKEKPISYEDRLLVQPTATPKVQAGAGRLNMGEVGEIARLRSLARAKRGYKSPTLTRRSEVRDDTNANFKLSPPNFTSDTSSSTSDTSSSTSDTSSSTSDTSSSPASAPSATIQKKSKRIPMTQEQITQKRNEFHSSFFGELVPKLERELLLMNGKAIVKDPTFKSDYELADEIKTYEDIRDPNQQQIETLRTLKAEQTRRGERYKKIEDVLLPLARKLALKEIAVDELPVEYAEEAKIYASEKLEDFMRLKDVEIVDKLPTPKKISKKRTGKSNASLPNTPVGPTSPSDSSASSSTSSPTSPPIRKGALTDGK